MQQSISSNQQALNPFNNYQFIQKYVDEQTKQLKIHAKYLRIRDLGCGSFGNCYQVRKTFSEDNLGVDCTYALKEIVARHSQGKQYEREKLKFQQEVKIMTKLSLNQQNSKYFATICNSWREVQSSPKKFYIVMDYYPNGTLRDYQNYLKENNQWYSQKEVVYFGYNILKALSIMHNMQLMHRDIKQTNILLDQDLNIKICDFGQAANIKLSKYCDVGSPLFKAPEIVQITRSQTDNNLKYSQKIDIWAVGVMMYYMIYKKYPFDGQNQNRKTQDILYQQILKDQVKYQNPQIPQLSNKLINLVKIMLQKDPSKRPSSQTLLKEQIFNGIDINQQAIKQLIRSKRNYYQIQVKSIFHIQNLGYFIVLQNAKRYLLKNRGQLVNLTHNYDYFLSEQPSLSNEQINQKINQLSESELKDLRYNCKILQNAYSKQRKILQLKFSFFNVKDTQTEIKNIIAIRKDVVMITLSNYVTQFYFGKQESQSNNLVFQTIVSFNYNNLNKKEIFFISKSYEPNGRKFPNLEQAMNNYRLKKYIQYIMKVLSLQLDNTNISLKQLNLQRKVNELYI